MCALAESQRCKTSQLGKGSIVHLLCEKHDPSDNGIIASGDLQAAAMLVCIRHDGCVNSCIRGNDVAGLWLPFRTCRVLCSMLYLCSDAACHNAAVIATLVAIQACLLHQDSPAVTQRSDCMSKADRACIPLVTYMQALLTWRLPDNFAVQRLQQKIRVLLV